MEGRLKGHIDALGFRVGSLESAVSSLKNRNANGPAGGILPIRGPVAPFLLPAEVVPAVYFPPTLAALGGLNSDQVNEETKSTGSVVNSSPQPLRGLQCGELLLLYHLQVLPQQVVAAGHTAAALAAAAATNKAALMAGIDRLGRHLNIRMDDSWERDMQRDARRALNSSATVAAHALKALQGPHPPFGLPPHFPDTAGAFRAMTLPEAKALSSFYALPHRAGHDELALRSSDIAAHVGFRE